MRQEVNRNCLVISIVIMMPQIMASQGVHNQIWYLNDSYRINWTSGSPIVEQVGQTSIDVEHVASYTNQDGHLSFYTDGLYVRNVEHDTIHNSDHLNGDISSNNSTLIVPYPSAPNKYLIFYSQRHNSPGTVSYSVLDMNLRNGNGAIVPNQKNIELFQNMGEYLSIAKGDCGQLWVVTRERNSNKFYFLSISKSGIGKINKVEIGDITTGGYSEVGSIKFNRAYDLMGFSSLEGSSINIYRFNKSKGSIEDYLKLPLEANNKSCGGISFSPNDSLFYVIEGRKVREPGRIKVISEVYQYDLSKNSPDEILQTKTLIANPDIGINTYSFMQIGLDGKIYITRRNRDYLGIIHEPNKIGVACNYEDDGLYMKGLLQRFARLPNLIVQADQLDLPRLDLSDNVVLCPDDTLSIELDARRFDSLIWSDGYIGYDRRITDDGTYILSAYAQGCITVDTINVSESEQISLPVDTVLCHSDSLIIDLSQYDDVVWSDGVTTSMRTIDESGVYDVSILDDSGCIITDSFAVSRGTPDLSFLPPDTIICSGEILQLEPNFSADSYLWSTNSSDREIEVSEQGLYFLEITTDNCTYRDSIMVDFIDCRPDDCNVYIPNALNISSTVGNQFFHIKSNCELPRYSMTIYDRWGNQIFGSSDPTKSWDGTYAGQPVGSGVYLYQLSFTAGESSLRTESGSLTVIR